MSDAEMFIHAFMTSRLDYCNAFLGVFSARLINKLQMVKNAAAIVLTRTRKYHHISLVVSTLHLLPIKHRIDFQILLITYIALNCLAPQYLSELLSELQMITAVNRSSPYADQMVYQHLETTR